jgi:hypothetical protein
LRLYVLLLPPSTFCPFELLTSSGLNFIGIASLHLLGTVIPLKISFPLLLTGFILNNLLTRGYFLSSGKANSARHLIFLILSSKVK